MNSNLPAFLDDDSLNRLAIIDAPTFADLSEAANLQLRAARRVDTLEGELSAAKEFLRRLSEDIVPGMFAIAGVSELKLSDGSVISVKPDVQISIPEDNRESAWDWMEAHSFGGLVKTEVAASFGSGEIDEARSLLHRLQDEGIAGNIKRYVHPQTLKAWAKERMSIGEELPTDIFNIRPFDKTTITPPKRK